jgi:hypothetical protein
LFSHFASNNLQGRDFMQFFAKKTILIASLVAAVTTVGVYTATAGGTAMLQRPVPRQTEKAAFKVETRSSKVIRIVGPQFLPDNGNIKLLGAAEERAKRG